MLSPEWAILPDFACIGIDSNHFDMTKFKTPNDQGFKKIVAELSRCLEDLSGTAHNVTLMAPSTGLKLMIEPAPSEGTVRTVGNEFKGQAAQFRASGLTITVREDRIVHGFYDWNESDPENSERASLLVLRFDVRNEASSAERKWCIQRLDVSLRFEADPPQNPVNDPYITGYELGAAGIVIHPNPVMETQEAEQITSTTATAPDPVRLEGTVSIKEGKKKEFEAEEKATCSARLMKTQYKGDGRKECNEVMWTLTKNKSQELPDTFTVAVVIKRPATPDSTNPNFKVTFDINAEVDVWYDLAIEWLDPEIYRFKDSGVLSKIYDSSKRGQSSPDLKDISRAIGRGGAWAGQGWRSIGGAFH